VLKCATRVSNVEKTFFTELNKAAFFMPFVCSDLHVSYDNLGKADPQAYEPTKIGSFIKHLISKRFGLR
jgi:hypothetical protein